MATYTGGSGDDVFNGSGGADTMFGLGGNDLYYVDDAGDVVVEDAGGGLDRVAASVSYVLSTSAEVEVLEAITLGATNALDLTGNGFAQTLRGNNGQNILRSEAGDDALFGYGGNDFLVGGAGADVMVGGTGDDTYYVDDTSDAITELAGEGNDRIAATITLALAADANIERIEVVNLTSTNAIDLTGSGIGNVIYGNDGQNILRGEAGNDELRGFGGNDFLVGGTGTDLMVGGLGDDTFYVDDASDAIGEIAGEGNDRIAASVSFVLSNGANVELLEAVNLLATTAFDLTGSDSNNTITGNNGVNVLRGEGGNDILSSAGGDDFLVGGSGVDSMTGGAGDDTYYVDNVADAVFEIAGEGTSDRVAASVSYALAANADVERLEADPQSGTNALNLFGSSIANIVVGNNGANFLDGRGGNDVLTGFGGADSFAFSTALSAGNVDTIIDFSVADDTIRLAGAAGEPFAALASGALAASSFAIGAAAADSNDYLIYNSGTGALLYDADGNGAGAAVQFATLGVGLSLTAADFMIDGPANNAPAITSGAAANVVENSPASTIVYQVQANDSDGDRITYSLTGGDAGLLTVDATGAVRLVASPDFETRTSYSFSVVASDSGSSTSKAVTLSVTDLNDSVSTPIINETAAANDAMGTAQFVDRATFLVANNNFLLNDDLPSATIQGSVSGNNDRDYYSITLQQGELLILDVDFTAGGLDSHLFVLGPSGTPLGDNDDQGVFDAGSTGIATTHNTDSYFQFRAPAAGTYYFYIQSFQGGSAGDYKINVSIGPPASAALIFEEDVDALISGAEWNRTNLTYGFPQSADQYPTQFDELSTNGNNEFQAFASNQQAATRLLIQLVQNVSALTFTELVGNAGQADLRYAMSTDDDVEAAHAYYPTNGGPTSAGGSSWYNTTSFNNPLKGNYAWMGILHETGHALGLEHGHEDAPTVSPEHDSLEFTVMTYRSYIGDTLSGGYSNGLFSYPQTLMMLDIAALQKMYGANFSINATDSVYAWNESTGEMSINGVGQGAPGTGAGGVENRVFLTIWDGNGADTYDMSNYGGGVIIDLRPGEWSTTSQTQIANLGDGNSARGNVASALQYQGNEASLIENAVGGAGNDSLTANEATNRLTGNGGADTFKWQSRADGGDTGGAADVIADFLRGSDKIDLSGIDANSGTGANDAFSFIGTDAFHNVAGELRYQIEGANLRIVGDTDGNGLSDFEIIVNNNTILASTDFIF